MSSGFQRFSQGANKGVSTPTSVLFDSAMPCTTELLPICQNIQDVSSQRSVNVAREVLPISAPVPVWGASLGKDALRSILEMRLGESTAEESQAHTFDERLEPNEPTEQNQPQGWLFPWPNLPAHEESRGATKPKMVIRPITPSTLIALTDPCLMGWCFTDAEGNSDPNNNGFGEASPGPLQTPHYLIEDFYTYLDQTGRMTNEWGY